MYSAVCDTLQGGPRGNPAGTPREPHGNPAGTPREPRFPLEDGVQQLWMQQILLMRRAAATGNPYANVRGTKGDAGFVPIPNAALMFPG